MIDICNYLDIPREKKDAVLEQLLQIGFSPAYGKQETMKKEMEKFLDMYASCDYNEKVCEYKVYLLTTKLRRQPTDNITGGERNANI